MAMEQSLVTLSNGLRLVFCPMPGVESVSIGVWVGVALLVGAIVGWTRQRGGGTVHEPLSIAPVGSSRVPNAH